MNKFGDIWTVEAIAMKLWFHVIPEVRRICAKIRNSTRVGSARDAATYACVAVYPALLCFKMEKNGKNVYYIINVCMGQARKWKMIEVCGQHILKERFLAHILNY